jgi:hypothetical protein
MATILVRVAALEEQRGNRTAALEYASEALDWNRRLGMVQEQEQGENLYTRLTKQEHESIWEP